MTVPSHFLDLLERLVRIETPSRDGPRLRALADVVEAEASQRGGRVERLDAGALGDHVSVRFWENAENGPANGAEPAPLLVLGHLDTVHPVGTLERIPFGVDDEGCLRGPGVYDMKGGVVAALDAVRRMREDGTPPAGPLHLLLTCDEEIGSASSRELIESAAREARATLVLEPCVPGGLAKVARKGVAGYDVVVHGRPAHAGIEPEAGASAIHALARLVGQLTATAHPEQGTTVNIGRIEGGSASNVVAERAWAEVDVRFWTRAEAERVDAVVRGLGVEDPRCRVEVTGGVNRHALEETEASRALFERARAEAASIGFDLAGGRTGGASDGNFASAVGCPTLDGLGPDGGGAHSMDEHVRMDVLPARLDLITRLMRTL